MFQYPWDLYVVYIVANQKNHVEIPNSQCPITRIFDAIKAAATLY